MGVEKGPNEKALVKISFHKSHSGRELLDRQNEHIIDNGVASLNSRPAWLSRNPPPVMKGGIVLQCSHECLNLLNEKDTEIFALELN